jgi:predicted enzyme related to lactoylglutathione lyase
MGNAGDFLIYLRRTMATVDHYAPGIPCWVDLMTTDPTAAAEFYSGLFGWDWSAGGEEVGGYIMAEIDGRAVAGIGGIPPEAPMMAMWNTYISTADVEDTLSRVAGAGGAVVVPAMEIVEGGESVGEMAMIADRGGAVVGVWQAGRHIGASRVNEPGALVWNELSSRDVAASRESLSAIFDWNYQQIGDGEDFDYTVIKVAGGNEDGVGGIMPMPAQVPAEVPGFWAAYFAVADTDAVAAATVEAGGTILQPPTDTPQGRMATLRDPQGAMFSVISPAEL